MAGAAVIVFNRISLTISLSGNNLWPEAGLILAGAIKGMPLTNLECVVLILRMYYVSYLYRPAWHVLLLTYLELVVLFLFIVCI